ncbi:MAG: DEAD/DEAH box helicase [Pseudomonadota bacterium]
MTIFSDLGLAEPILRAVTDTGYTAPTPIQAQVIPAMLDGQDVVGIAQTGTGKTAAFVLPILHKLASDDDKVGHRRVKVLMMVPTRELATQIADGLKIYGKHINVKSTVVVGGVKPGGQLKALANGLDIVIATPGRLLDHLQSGAVRLDKTTTVILDEADQMLDLGFMPAIRKIMAKLPRQRQTAMLSATMPKQIRNLADDFLNNPVEVSVAPAAKPIEKIDQSVCFVPAKAKRAVLVQLLADREVERAIVFTRTKHGADRVVKYLDKAGLLAAAIHGNKSQNNRQKTLNAFRAGQLPILVATDVAARGIDIDDVSHVINYELPNVAESYVHRIGRTARAGRSGVAIALCDPSERKHLRGIERLTKVKLAVRDISVDDAMEAELAAQALATEQRGAAPQEEQDRDDHRGRSQGKRRGPSSRQRHKSGKKPQHRQDRSHADKPKAAESTDEHHKPSKPKPQRHRSRATQRKNRKIFNKTNRQKQAQNQNQNQPGSPGQASQGESGTSDKDDRNKAA